MSLAFDFIPITGSLPLLDSYQNTNIMLSVLSGLDQIYLIESRMFLLMEVILSCFQSYPWCTIRFCTGPVTFLICINYLQNAFFADDTSIYYESKDLSDLIKILSKELILVQQARKQAIFICQRGLVIWVATG